MPWARLALAAIVAGTSVSLTDWLFFGVLFHEKYQMYPEVWRTSQEGIRHFAESAACQRGKHR